MKWILQTKKDFITCSKLITHELGRFPTRSENVYFASNKEASLSFTAAFCFAHAEYNLIKLQLYNNWSAQAVKTVFGSMLCENQPNQSNCLPVKIANESTLNKVHVI